MFGGGNYQKKMSDINCYTHVHTFLNRFLLSFWKYFYEEEKRKYDHMIWRRKSYFSNKGFRDFEWKEKIDCCFPFGLREDVSILFYEGTMAVWI